MRIAAPPLNDLRGRSGLSSCRTATLACVAGLLVSLVCLAGAPDAQAPAGHHSLWRVHGLHNSVYLLGSVHFLKPTDYPLPAAIPAAYSNCPVVAFETDLGQMQEPAKQKELLEKARLPAGETLRQQLTPDTFQKFKNHLHDSGFPGDIFNTLKPAVAAMTLELLEMEKLGFNPDYGVDQHFYQRARSDGKKILALETVDFQIDLLTAISAEQGERLMKTTLEEIDDTKRQLNEMISSWRTGNAGGLEKLLLHALANEPALEKRMLTDRNRRWLPHVEEWARGTQNVMVIVGAGHLVGTNGVVSLLTRQGWTVDQE